MRGIGFTVAAGEIFGFLGPNGAGKTTTIKILCTLLQATSGTARLAGLDVASSPAEVRRRIGVIFQDPSLDDRLTAEENLMFHAVAYRVPRAERARAHRRGAAVRRSVRAPQDLTRTFSGGMKRRLEIARGLLHAPTSCSSTSRPPASTRRPAPGPGRCCAACAEKYGTTLFITTHYMDEAENCDRIAIIDHGQMSRWTRRPRSSSGSARIRSRPGPAIPRAWPGCSPRSTASTSTPADGGLTFLVAEGDAFIVKLLTAADGRWRGSASSPDAG